MRVEYFFHAWRTKRQAGGVFMRVFRCFMACSALCCLLCLQAVIAQDTGQKTKQEDKCPAGAQCPEKEKPKPLLPTETIVVTSIFQDGAVTLEPTKTVIDVSKFGSSGNVNRVEDILMHITGIDVIQGTGGVDPQQEVMMRGFDDSRFTVAVNGRPITSSSARSETFVDWSSLTTGDIEKIEITRGSASAKFESSVGGVINIITKKRHKENTLTPKSSAEASYSSFNTWETKGMIRGGAGPLGYLVNFGSSKSDGFLRNNYYDGMNYSGRLDYELPGKGSISTTFKRSEIELGYPVVNDPGYFDYDPDYPLVKRDADTIRLGRNISYPGGQSYKIRKAAHFDLNYDQPLGHTNLSIKLYQSRGSEDTHSFEWNAKSKKPADVFAGQDSRRERTRGVMFDYLINLWAKHSITVGYSHRRMEVAATPDIYRIHAGYIEDQYALTNKLILNMGLRYVELREYSYAYKGPNDKSSYRHINHTKEWLPKFTATYKFDKNTEVFTSVSRDYHVPGC